MYNVTRRGVHITIVVVEKQKVLQILSVSVALVTQHAVCVCPIIQVCAAYRRFGQRRTACTSVVPYDYNNMIHIIVLQLPTVFSSVTCSTDL